MSEAETITVPHGSSLLDLPVDSLGRMSMRLHNVLTKPDRCNCTTVRNVIAMSERQFKRVPHAGKQTTIELIALLKYHGLALAPDPDRVEPRQQLLMFPLPHDRLAELEDRIEEIERRLNDIGGLPNP